MSLFTIHHVTAKEASSNIPVASFQPPTKSINLLLQNNRPYQP